MKQFALISFRKSHEIMGGVFGGERSRVASDEIPSSQRNFTAIGGQQRPARKIITALPSLPGFQILTLRRSVPVSFMTFSTYTTLPSIFANLVSFEKSLSNKGWNGSSRFFTSFKTRRSFAGWTSYFALVTFFTTANIAIVKW